MLTLVLEVAAAAAADDDDVLIVVLHRLIDYNLLSD